MVKDVLLVATPPAPDPGRSGMKQSGLRFREMVERVLYALHLPIVRLAFHFRVSLKRLTQLAQMAYFQHSRRQGLKLDEVAALMGVSMRKASLLSTQLKQNFLMADQEHGLPRRLEFALWANPLSEARLCQVMPREDPKAIGEALATLKSQGRVTVISGRVDSYAVNRKQHRLVEDTWLARLDALDNLSASVASVVRARFFDEDPRAFARTVSIHIREASIPRLQALYEEVIWPALVALEAEAESDPDSPTLDLSLIWAPRSDAPPTPPQQGETR
jgi:hypothetical protein